MSSNINTHAAIITQMVAEGKTPKEILKKLRELGCKVTIKALQLYLKENNLQLNDSPPIETGFTNNYETYEVQALKSRSFNFESNCFSEDFDAVHLAEFLQKAHYFLYKRQLEIVGNEQEEYYLGYSDSQPIHSLRKLQILADLFYKIAPIHIIANQNEAIKVIQRMGYTISIDGENLNNVDNQTDTCKN